MKRYYIEKNRDCTMRDDTRIADALFRRIDETIILHAETEKSDAVPGFDRCLRTARSLRWRTTFASRRLLIPDSGQLGEYSVHAEETK